MDVMSRDIRDIAPSSVKSASMWLLLKTGFRKNYHRKLHARSQYFKVMKQRSHLWKLILEKKGFQELVRIRKQARAFSI